MRYLIFSSKRCYAEARSNDPNKVKTYSLNSTDDYNINITAFLNNNKGILNAKFLKTLDKIILINCDDNNFNDEILESQKKRFVWYAKAREPYGPRNVFLKHLGNCVLIDFGSPEKKVKFTFSEEDEIYYFSENISYSEALFLLQLNPKTIVGLMQHHLIKYISEESIKILNFGDHKYAIVKQPRKLLGICLALAYCDGKINDKFFEQTTEIEKFIELPNGALLSSEIKNKVVEQSYKIDKTLKFLQMIRETKPEKGQHYSFDALGERKTEVYYDIVNHFRNTLLRSPRSKFYFYELDEKFEGEVNISDKAKEHEGNKYLSTAKNKEAFEDIKIDFIYNEAEDDFNWHIKFNRFEDNDCEVPYQRSKGIRIMAYMKEYTLKNKRSSAIAIKNEVDRWIKKIKGKKSIQTGKITDKKNIDAVKSLIADIDYSLKKQIFNGIEFKDIDLIRDRIKECFIIKDSFCYYSPHNKITLNFCDDSLKELNPPELLNPKK